MPIEPPTYGSREYWDQRFTKDSNPFEWLSAPDTLDPFITDALRSATDSEPELLHIGCGSSLLSYHLRAHVKSPKQIHNLDYSKIVVDVGKQREVDLFACENGLEGDVNACEELEDKPTAKRISSKSDLEQAEPWDTNVSSNGKAVSNGDTDKFMRWDATDLLDLRSLLGACKPNTYSVIIDKSTSDCIACADDVEVPLPYPLSYGPETSRDCSPGQTSLTYPVQLMAVHLALVTKPGARWISLSYSAERYYFLDAASSHSSMSAKQEHEHEPDGALPDARLLWRVLGKYELEAAETQSTGAQQRNGGVVHTPKVYHWAYVLERTETPVVVRSERL